MYYIMNDDKQIKYMKYALKKSCIKKVKDVVVKAFAEAWETSEEKKYAEDKLGRWRKQESDYYGRYMRCHSLGRCGHTSNLQNIEILDQKDNEYWLKRKQGKKKIAMFIEYMNEIRGDAMHITIYNAILPIILNETITKTGKRWFGKISKEEKQTIDTLINNMLGNEIITINLKGKLGFNYIMVMDYGILHVDYAIPRWNTEYKIKMKQQIWNTTDENPQTKWNVVEKILFENRDWKREEPIQFSFLLDVKKLNWFYDKWSVIKEKKTEYIFGEYNSNYLEDKWTTPANDMEAYYPFVIHSKEQCIDIVNIKTKAEIETMVQFDNQLEEMDQGISDALDGMNIKNKVKFKF